MSTEGEKQIGFKLNISQVLQAIMIFGIIGLWTRFSKLEENTTISIAERQGLKEDITELKDEVRFLRTLLYTSMKVKEDIENGHTD